MRPLRLAVAVPEATLPPAAFHDHAPVWPVSVSVADVSAALDGVSWIPAAVAQIVTLPVGSPPGFCVSLGIGPQSSSPPVVLTLPPLAMSQPLPVGVTFWWSSLVNFHE